MTRAVVTKEDARREMVLGSATLVIAAGYYLLAIRIPQSEIADVIGAQGLPKAYAALLALLSLALIGRAARARRVALDAQPASTASGTAAPRHAGWRTAGMLVTGALYVALVPWVGYLLAVAGLLASTIYLQGGRIDRRAGVVSTGGALVLWLLFVRLLHIPHPAGIWPSMF